MHNYHVSMYTELSSLLLAFYVPQGQVAATPLLTACFDNQVDVAKYLITKKANINYQNKVINCLYCFHNLFIIQGFAPQNLGESSLHCACKNGHTNVAKLLINSQADLQIKNNVSVDLLVPCMGMGSYFTCH